METTRLNRRKLLLVVGGFVGLLVAQYLFFWGYDLFQFQFAKPVEFKIPQGYKGILFVSVWSTIRKDTDSGVFRLNLGSSVNEKLSWGMASEMRLDLKGTSLACVKSKPMYSDEYRQIGTESDLFVCDQNGEKTHLAHFITTSNPGYLATPPRPVWSPDGNWIFHTDCDFPLGNDGGWDFSRAKTKTWKYAKDGSSKTQLTFPERHVVCDLSPDGHWFLTSKNSEMTSDKSEEYFLIDANDSSKSLALSFEERIFKARFSPDGSKLIFGFPREKDNVHTIGSRDLKSEGQSVKLGSQTTVIDRGHLGYWLNDFACSPDGQLLAVASFNQNNFVPNAKRQNVCGNLRLVKLTDETSEELSVTHAEQIHYVELR